MHTHAAGPLPADLRSENTLQIFLPVATLLLEGVSHYQSSHVCQAETRQKLPAYVISHELKPWRIPAPAPAGSKPARTALDKSQQI